LVDGQDVADVEASFLSSVDVLTTVHSFDSNEVLSALFVFVLVSEANLSKRSTSAGVMNDVSHNTLNVTLSLSVIDGPKAGRSDSLASVGLEDSGVSVTLRSDYFSH